MLTVFLEVAASIYIFIHTIFLSTHADFQHFLAFILLAEVNAL